MVARHQVPEAFALQQPMCVLQTASLIRYMPPGFLGHPKRLPMGGGHSNPLASSPQRSPPTLLHSSLSLCLLHVNRAQRRSTVARQHHQATPPLKPDACLSCAMCKGFTRKVHMSRVGLRIGMDTAPQDVWRKRAAVWKERVSRRAWGAVPTGRYKGPQRG